MSKLSCNARSCINNDGGMCGAGYIMIESVDSDSTLETYCSKYQSGTVTNETQSMVNGNYMGDLMQVFSSMENARMNPEVNCHATKCFYNLYGKCEARNISISVDGTDSLKARCETFAQ